MARGGSDLPRSDPDVSAEDVEALRRRLYMPGGAERDVSQYLTARERTNAEEQLPLSGEEAASSGREPDSGSRQCKRRRVLIWASSIMLVGVVAGVWFATVRTALPDVVAPPAAPGETLLFYSRPNNPESAPDKVTFEPADERMVFSADGHRIAVVLRCIGSGEVRITVAEQPFRFYCGAQMQTLVQRSDRRVTGPFFIFGRTVGNVVWGLRVTRLPLGT